MHTPVTHPVRYQQHMASADDRPGGNSWTSNALTACVEAPASRLMTLGSQGILYLCRALKSAAVFVSWHVAAVMTGILQPT